MKTGRRDPVERGESGRHRYRVARQRARLVDGSERRDVLHDLAAAAEGADRHTTPDDLAQRREVGTDPVQRLSAPECDPEPGHHLVEDKHGAVPRALLAQCLEESGHRRDAVHVAGNRLDDGAGHLRTDLGERCAKLRDVVVRKRDRVRRQLGWYPWRGRYAQGERAGARLHEQRVRVTVITTLELDDPISMRVAARKPDGTHCGLRSGAHHPHQLDRRYELADTARERRLDLRRRAERQAVGRLVLDGADYFRVRVTKDHRAPRPHVVDELPPVRCPDVGTLRAGQEYRLTTDTTERTHGRVDPTRDVSAGIRVKAHATTPEQTRAGS